MELFCEERVQVLIKVHFFFQSRNSSIILSLYSYSYMHLVNTYHFAVFLSFIMQFLLSQHKFMFLACFSVYTIFFKLAYLRNVHLLNFCVFIFNLIDILTSYVEFLMNVIW